MKTIFILLGVILTSIFSVSDTFAGTNSKIYISEVVYDANYKTFDITYCSNWSGTLGATDINVKIVTPKVIRMTHRLEDGFWGMDECDVITIGARNYKPGKKISVTLNSLYGSTTYRGVPVIESYSNIEPVRSTPINSGTQGNQSQNQNTNTVVQQNTSLSMDTSSVKISSSGLVSYSFLPSTSNNKGFKRYSFIPSPGLNASFLFGSLNLDNWKYSSGDFYTSGNQQYMVRVHGYSINPSQVDQALLLFGQNGYSEVTNINPTTGFYAINPSAFVLSKLSDNTYRNFYLYVSSDGSEAYLVHFIQSIFQ